MGEAWSSNGSPRARRIRFFNSRKAHSLGKDHWSTMKSRESQMQNVTIQHCYDYDEINLCVSMGKALVSVRSIMLEDGKYPAPTVKAFEIKDATEEDIADLAACMVAISMEFHKVNERIEQENAQKGEAHSEGD